jgi:hypothetical protein
MGFVLIEKVLAGAGPEPLTATSKTGASAIVQAKRGNSNLCQIGPSSTLASGKGLELVAPAAGVQLPAIAIQASGQNCLELHDWYITGTQGEGVNIVLEEF